MAYTIDRFELSRDTVGRIVKGWRVTRYSFGITCIQHLRTGRSHTGVDDGFGNIICPENNIHKWSMETEEIVPFYR